MYNPKAGASDGTDVVEGGKTAAEGDSAKSVFSFEEIWLATFECSEAEVHVAMD